MKKLPLYLSFNDVLLLPQSSAVKSRDNISLKTRITPNIELDLPLIAINMDTITGVNMAVAISRLGGIAFYPRFDSIDNQVSAVKKILKAKQKVIPAIGIKSSEKDRLQALVDIGIKTVTVDVAHAHLQICLDFINWAKKEFKQLEIIAGVIGTYQGACDLYRAGADAIRVGVGCGTICTTRVQTGHGIPQITALMDCYRASQEFNRPLIADGGTKNSGDMVKSLACGASAVVTGSLFAGTTETPGKTIRKNNRSFKAYNGSTSKTEKLSQLKKNSVDKTENYVNYVEGVESLVPLKGSLKDIIAPLEKGIRSGLSYSGVATIPQLHQKARFVQVTSTIAYENNHRGVLVDDHS